MFCDDMALRERDVMKVFDDIYINSTHRRRAKLLRRSWSARALFSPAAQRPVSELGVLPPRRMDATRPQVRCEAGPFSLLRPGKLFAWGCAAIPSTHKALIGLIDAVNKRTVRAWFSAAFVFSHCCYCYC